MFRLLSTERGAIAELDGKAMELQPHEDKPQLNEGFDDIAAGTNAEIMVSSNIIGEVIVSIPMSDRDWYKLRKSEVWKNLCQYLEEVQTPESQMSHSNFLGLPEMRGHRNLVQPPAPGVYEHGIRRLLGVLRKGN